jgi:hypothetical protein
MRTVTADGTARSNLSTWIGNAAALRKDALKRLGRRLFLYGRR